MNKQCNRAIVFVAVSLGAVACAPGAGSQGSEMNSRYQGNVPHNASDNVCFLTEGTMQDVRAAVLGPGAAMVNDAPTVLALIDEGSSSQPSGRPCGNEVRGIVYKWLIKVTKEEREYKAEAVGCTGGTGPTYRAGPNVHTWVEKVNGKWVLHWRAHMPGELVPKTGCSTLGPV